MKTFEQYLESVIVEAKEVIPAESNAPAKMTKTADNKPARKTPEGGMQKSGDLTIELLLDSMSPEMRARAEAEIKHFKSQPVKAARALTAFFSAMIKIQLEGRFLSAMEAEKLLNDFKEFDKDIKNPRYFKMLKKALTGEEPIDLNLVGLDTSKLQKLKQKQLPV
jgi:hypothetical protein